MANRTISQVLLFLVVNTCSVGWTVSFTDAELNAARSEFERAKPPTIDDANGGGPVKVIDGKFRWTWAPVATGGAKPEWQWVQMGDGHRVGKKNLSFKADGTSIVCKDGDDYESVSPVGTALLPILNGLREYYTVPTGTGKLVKAPRYYFKKEGKDWVAHLMKGVKLVLRKTDSERPIFEKVGLLPPGSKDCSQVKKDKSFQYPVYIAKREYPAVPMPDKCAVEYWTADY